jgi:hypothetical protein
LVLPVGASPESGLTIDEMVEDAAEPGPLALMNAGAAEWHMVVVGSWKGLVWFWSFEFVGC